ncbi:MAG: DedA family protein, partial [Dehalococcoidia bacterium]
PWLIYVVVGALTFGESAAFLSLVMPGEIALVAAAAVGVPAGVNPLLLVAVASFGALVGGIFGYAVGRRYGARLMAWEPISRKLGTRMTELTPLLAGPEAGALVAVARFNQLTRAVVPALAGMAEMGRVRFAVANGIGALVWAGVFTAIGHYAAEWWRSTSGLVHILMAVVVATGVGTLLLARWRRRATAVTVAEESFET